MDEKQAKRLFAVAVGSVLVAALAWVGYSLHWIRQRHRILDNPEVMLLPFPCTSVPAKYFDDDPAAPCGLWLFGEYGVRMVGYPLSWPRAERERVKRLFPEADFGEDP